MVRVAEDREVAVRYGERGFGKRPDVLKHPSDIMEHAKRGTTSFHCSEERWSNPLQIDRSMRTEELNSLRSGWDLLIDIDCKLLEYSKITAFYTVKVLKYYDIKSITCKFSGNKGFHIAVPFESFPSSIGGKPTKELFPEAPRKIAAYLKFLIKDPVSEAIMNYEKHDFEAVVKKTGMDPNEIIRKEANEFGDIVEKLNAEPFLDIDTILISSRHLFRMPFSFHEKSQLVSVPIPLDKILSFKKEYAKPENVKIQQGFLDRSAEKNEAGKLVVQAFDFEPKIEEEAPKKRIEYDEISDAIPEAFFPPCMKIILQGLKDGKKRSIFVLKNFLRNIGWSNEQIKARLEEWNKVNGKVGESLRQVYIEGQLRYNEKNKSPPPPNCNNKSYYIDLGVCKPDDFCRRIKNPLMYTILKSKDSAKRAKRKHSSKKKSTPSKSKQESKSELKSEKISSSSNLNQSDKAKN